MSNLVIVAIPRDDDPVWKYSSEKKPHCTLLFLGEDQSKSMDIAAFLQHAVTIMDRGPFGLSVDHRGILGDDKADVLFFKKDWSAKQLASFRATLLKDKNIRDAYDSTTQFPEWNPHLTMGYPQSPAKKDDRDYPGFHWVEFDRIALWTGDFEGPEFRLEYNYDREAEVMMTAAEKAVADVLEHHGVKGMKWGVRRDSLGRNRWDPKGHSSADDVLSTAVGLIVPVVAPLAIPATVRNVRRVTQQATFGSAKRQDKKFDLAADSQDTFLKVHNDARTGLKAGQAKLNAKYQGVNLKDPKNVAKKRKYNEETKDMMLREYQKAAGKRKSKSGNLKYDIELGDHADTFKIVTKKVRHADGDTETIITLKGVYDPKLGHLIDWKIDSLAHAEEVIDFLSHYGVKGMKWGVRRETAKVTTSQGRTFTDKAKVKAVGGTGQKAHTDAVKSEVVKQKVKKSGVKSASNKELQTLIERARLENQAREAVQSTGQKFIKKKLGTQLDQTTNQFVQQQIRDAQKRRN